jgi:signal transduction histidine kinase
VDPKSSLADAPPAAPNSEDAVPTAVRLLHDASSLTADTPREAMRAIYHGRAPHSRRHAVHVALLARAIADVVRGRSARLSAFPSRAPARPLLDLLRSNYLMLVTKLAPELPSRDVAFVLQAIDEVRTILEHDTARRVADELEGVDALELVVQVAHDMRSPLTSMLFLIDSLRSQGTRLLQTQQRQLLIVYGAAYALSALVNDMLALARGGDHLLDATDVAFSVHECLQSVRDVAQPIAEERQLALDISWPESDYRVGRPAALRRVLLNLVTNALKFTEKGTITVTATEKGRSRVIFEVSDTGTGLPPEVAAFVQDSFRWTGEWRANGVSSAGLGLSVCRKLLEMMGSKLTLRADSAQGTTFAFDLRLPVAKRL